MASCAATCSRLTVPVGSILRTAAAGDRSSTSTGMDPAVRWCSASWCIGDVVRERSLQDAAAEEEAVPPRVEGRGAEVLTQAAGSPERR